MENIACSSPVSSYRKPFGRRQREFDDELAKTLDSIADPFEGQQPARRESGLEACFKHSGQTAQTLGRTDLKGVLPEEVKTFLILSGRLARLATSLDTGI